MTYARTSSLLAKASGLSGRMQRNSCLVEAMIVVENARVNDRLRKVGEVSLVRWNMSVDEVDEKGRRLRIYCFCLSRLSLGTLIRIEAEMGRFGVGHRGTVSQCGECSTPAPDTKMIRKDDHTRR